MATILITGGHGGIGLWAVQALAAEGIDILLAGRDMGRLEATASTIRSRHAVTVTSVILDVSSLQSVRDCAAQCRAMIDSGKVGHLKAILCNAGATFRGDPTYTADGYELTFATNYLGHFLLVQLLLDMLEDNGRIVFTASGTHDPDTADGKFIGRAVAPDAIALAKTGSFGGKTLTGGQRYTTSKLCTVLHSRELARRLTNANSTIRAIAYDPGAIAETGLLRDLPGPARAMIGSKPVRWLMRRMGLTLGDLHQSGLALAEIATSDTFSSGHYYQWKDGHVHERRSAEMSYDDGLARALWRDSESLAELDLDEKPARLK